jgi:hypothetical protein
MRSRESKELLKTEKYKFTGWSSLKDVTEIVAKSLSGWSAPN